MYFFKVFALLRILSPSCSAALRVYWPRRAGSTSNIRAWKSLLVVGIHHLRAPVQTHGLWHQPWQAFMALWCLEKQIALVLCSCLWLWDCKLFFPFPVAIKGPFCTSWSICTWCVKYLLWSIYDTACMSLWVPAGRRAWSLAPHTAHRMTGFLTWWPLLVC